VENEPQSLDALYTPKLSDSFDWTESFLIGSIRAGFLAFAPDFLLVKRFLVPDTYGSS